MNILLAEDERAIRVTLGDDLEDAGHKVTAVGDGKEAMQALAEQAFDVVITDIRMPGVDGIQLLDHVREHYADTAVIMITGVPTYELAVQCIKKGAEDFIAKPFNHDEVLVKLEKLAERLRDRAEIKRLRSEFDKPIKFENLIGRSPKMQEIFKLIRQVSEHDIPILLKGESGTGKELFARAIHQNSSRAKKPMVTVACHVGNINLLESELFGHVKGAYTGAERERKGKFQEADGGTIFLDDIDDMPLDAQVKLLRVLQEGEVEVLGRTGAPVQVDTRVIAATKVDLEAAIEDDKFRLDLYYRINTLVIEIPPLRQRVEDIPLLVNHFIEKYNQKYGVDNRYSVPDDTMIFLSQYHWPGNVRELEGAVYQAIAVCPREEPVLKREHFRNLQRSGSFKADDPATGVPMVTLREAIEAAERAHIERVMKHTENNTVKAAEILDISRKNLWEKRKKYDIAP